MSKKKSWAKFLILGLLTFITFGLCYAIIAKHVWVDANGICDSNGNLGDAYSVVLPKGAGPSMEETSARLYWNIESHPDFADLSNYCYVGKSCKPQQITVVPVCTSSSYYDSECAKLGQTRVSGNYPFCGDCVINDLLAIAKKNVTDRGEMPEGYTLIRDEFDRSRRRLGTDFHVVIWSKSSITCFYQSTKMISAADAVASCALRMSQTKRYCKRAHIA